MTILFEPKFKIGDSVYLRINPEKKYMIDGYFIRQINNNSEVIFYEYSVFDGEGGSFRFMDTELELYEC